MKNSTNYEFKDWLIESVKGHILPSKGELRDLYETEIQLPHLPDMLFADNVLRLKHKNGFGLEFKAFDALKLVDPKADLIKVSVAKEWKESRADCEFVDKMVKPFDWTFTTPYKGTITSTNGAGLCESQTDQRIDMEKLKIPELIMFFDEVCLFDDELSDHGTANLNVKLRVMPTGFYILQRYFLRVDDVVIRLYETRIYHDVQTDFLLREYSEKESLVKDIKCNPRLLTDPNALSGHLSLKCLTVDRLNFPNTTNDRVSSTD
jgi:type 2A phosphatase activator TIP41